MAKTALLLRWITSQMYDFFSDTKTKPSRAMREAILDCPVGDEQKGEDPTTLALCERVAGLLGKEAAVFLPTGTMCNEIAVKVHTRHGDEIICEETSHLINFETGGPAALSGVMIRALSGKNGTFNASLLEDAIRPPSRYAPRTSLVCVEQTANMGGGTVWSLEQLNAVSDCARQAGVATHMDGARLLNASAATGVPASDYAAGYDSVWIDFSKGLGCPMGAVLAGSTEFVDQAWRLKQQLGGAMRQSGIIAAMCHFALDNNLARLVDDHTLAADLASHISAFTSVKQVLPVETNIVIFDLKANAPTAKDVVETLKSNGVHVGAFGPRRVRIVTHLDVDTDAGQHLLSTLGKYLSEEGAT